MVQKNKKKDKKHGHSKHPSDAQNKKSHSKPAPKSETAIYQDLNALLEQGKQLNPCAYYTFSLVSRTWLRTWRASFKKKETEALSTLNADLLHPNPYKLPEKICVPDEQQVLLNNIDLDYEYEICTDEAWQFLSGRYPSVRIQKLFYLNENYNFEETTRLLALNVIIIDEETAAPSAQLLQLEETRFSEKIIDQICYYFNIESEQADLYLMDTRLWLEEILTGLKDDNIIFGKSLPLDSPFSFKHLKSFEIICLALKRPKHVVSLSPKTEGLCYNCRNACELKHKCGCVIASYCSIDCKYSDYLAHKFICPNLADALEDVSLDLKQWENRPSNKGNCGLANIGNSCYLNCLLEILRDVPEIKNGFAQSSLEKMKQSNFLLSLAHIIRKIGLFEGEGLKPWPLKISLGLISSNFLYFAQNDAAECLDAILNALEDSGVEEAVKASEAFKGSFVTRFKCLGCGHIKVQKKEEKFFILALSLFPEKTKFQCEFFKRASEKNPLELISKKVVLKESELNFDSLAEKVFPEMKEASKALIFLSDKERIRAISDQSEPIEPLIIRQRQDIKFQETIFYVEEFKEMLRTFIFASFSGIQIYNKHLEIKSKLCNSRPIEISKEFIDAENFSVSIRGVHLEVFKYLIGYFELIEDFSSFFSEFALEKDSEFFWLFYCRLLNINCNSSKNEILKEDEENNQQANLQRLQQFAQKLEERIKPMGQIPYVIKFVNREHVCANCSKKGEHFCSLVPSEKRIQLREVNKSTFAIEIAIEFPSNSQLLPHVKKLTEAERSLPPHSKKEIISAPYYSVNSSLENYFDPQRIERNCKHCQGNQSTMAVAFNSFPKYLVIHLKRFTQKLEKNGYVHVKLEEFVDFDFEMKLEGRVYHLTGLVNHKGDLDHGHYTSFAYNRESKAWLYYDDAKFEVVENPNRMKSKDNYILIYELVQENN